MGKGWGYRFRCPFFGLTPEYKLHLHKQIFELAYNSQGAINVDIAYDLPIHLRNFYYKQLVDIVKKQSDSTQDSSTSSKKRISKPF